MIPSGLLESIVTSKSYSPDQPGDYAGGLVQLRTRDFPSNRILNFSASGGWNSEASFKDGIGYAGGGLDFFGFDDGTRDIPSIIPRDIRVSSANFDDQTLQQFGRAFQGDWGPTERKLPMNGGFSFSYGGRFDIGESQRAGFIASANYSSDQSFRSNMVERVFAASGEADPEVDYRGEVADRSVSMGGLVNLTYQPRPTDQIKLATVYNHVSNDVSRILTGFNLDSGVDQWNSRIQFTEQTLVNSQLEGQHLLGFLGNATINWRGAYTRAARYEPSTREALYREFGGDFIWTTSSRAGRSSTRTWWTTASRRWLAQAALRLQRRVGLALRGRKLRTEGPHRVHAPVPVPAPVGRSDRQRGAHADPERALRQRDLHRAERIRDPGSDLPHRQLRRATGRRRGLRDGRPGARRRPPDLGWGARGALAAVGLAPGPVGHGSGRRGGCGAREHGPAPGRQRHAGAQRQDEPAGVGVADARPRPAPRAGTVLVRRLRRG